MKEPSIIYEDNHLLGVNKPAGWLVQGDKTGDYTLLDWAKNYIKEKYQKPGDVFLGCIHRIDRPVSGVVLFARTSKALERMNALLSKGAIRKTYLALTKHQVNPASGKLENYLDKDEKRNISFVVKQPSQGKRCILEYELIRVDANQRSLLKIHPLTGRPHQIRVQLSHAGWPIIGDLKYGAHQPLPDASIALQCAEMYFQHPITQLMVAVKSDPLTIFGELDYP